MESPDPTKKVVDEILLGRHNGALPEIIAACKLVDEGNRVQWRLSIDGLPEITTQNVTMFELDRFERVSGVLWADYLGNPLVSMRLLAALLSAVLTEREGLDGPAIRERLKGLTADKAVAGFSHYEVDGVPLVQPEQGNETST